VLARQQRQGLPARSVPERQGLRRPRQRRRRRYERGPLPRRVDADYPDDSDDPDDADYPDDTDYPDDSDHSDNPGDAHDVDDDFGNDGDVNVFHDAKLDTAGSSECHGSVRAPEHRECCHDDASGADDERTG
jgi:hypothetical protein